ncbi:hypothetical protein JIN85_13865 [Luteolibacter pohnpeiensis]|uniref:Uncharacterized protein n=1 Tax=Luteolibacter pohnpeiensis TaxID=454153 RepID=A0A934SCR7_9BACT|nr:hypothetical protein [Luteolibacter pohnpeiensis]MBK1883509.1 hypothetical protein [Luteolibacter pohnpeiensis]
MKISLALSVLILLVAAWLRTTNHQHVSELRAQVTALRGKTNETSNKAEWHASKRELRPSHESNLKALTVDSLDYLHDIEAASYNEQNEFSPRYGELLARIKLLDTDSFEQFITAVRDADDLSQSTREDFLAWVMATFSSKDPHGVLDIFTRGFDFPGCSRFRSLAINNTISSLASDDPYAAAAWLEQHGKEFPGIALAKSLVITNLKDQPEAAFDMVRKLEMERPYEEIESIIDQSKTPEKRTESLEAFRRYITTVESDTIRAHLVRDATHRFIQSAATNGFEKGSAWLEENFTPEEIKEASKSNFTPTSEQWKQWLEQYQ